MGYDQFTSLSAAREAYRRKRLPVWFILARSNENPDCVHCKRPIFDFSGKRADGELMHPPGYQNNRCIYDPRSKRIIPMHYTCTWEHALHEIAYQRFI